MKEITAILINYSDQSDVDSALTSLKIISSRLESVIMLQDNKSLNDTISKLKSEYVLLLCHTDYLSPDSDPASFEMKPSTSVLGQIFHYKNINLYHPLLIRTSLFKKHPFLLNHQLPFKEALLPAWLSTIDDSLKVYKESLVKRPVKNNTADWMEKQRFAEKYQLKNTTHQPSLSILIANYNMEDYIETAITSCLLQNEQAEQICIMDDGSTDNSFKKIKKWQDKSKVQIFQKQNGGKARALNDLLPHVTSDFILELDADDWLDANAVSVIKSHLANLPEDIAVLYGNLRKWKQLTNDVLYKNKAMGRPVKSRSDLLTYHFPLGPRIYRTSALKEIGGFPVIDFNSGRLFEDVSVLNCLIKNYRFHYKNFTVYNVREHTESITSKNTGRWNDFLKTLKT